MRGQGLLSGPGPKRRNRHGRTSIATIALYFLGAIAFCTFLIYRMLPDEDAVPLTDEEALFVPNDGFCRRHKPPLVCAHGGQASEDAPTNTLAAFRRALDEGASCVEVDAAQTKDGTLVCVHTRELSARTGRPASQASHYTWDELQGLDMGGGHRIPSVADVIDAVNGRAEVITVDVKPAADEQGRDVGELEITVAVMDLVQEAECHACLVWAKSDVVVQEAKRLSPRTRAGYVVMNETAAHVREGRAELLRMEGPEVVAIHHAMVDEDVLRRTHEAGKELHAWTANTAGMMRRLLDVGVDAIVTNHPSKLLDAVQRRWLRCPPHPHIHYHW